MPPPPSVALFDNPEFPDVDNLALGLPAGAVEPAQLELKDDAPVRTRVEADAGERQRVLHVGQRVPGSDESFAVERLGLLQRTDDRRREPVPAERQRVADVVLVALRRHRLGICEIALVLREERVGRVHVPLEGVRPFDCRGCRLVDGSSEVEVVDPSISVGFHPIW